MEYKIVNSSDSQKIIEILQPFITENKMDKIDKISKDRTNYLTVVLEDIYQPHNASAVVRTCECFGVQNMHIIENRNQYNINPNIVLGSSKWVNLNRYNEAGINNSKPCIENLKKQGYKLVATTPHKDGYDLENLPLDSKIALMFGTEKEGLSDYAMKEADMYCKVPMFGFTESLNISVTAALFIHYLTTKIHKEINHWRLNEVERTELIAHWYQNCLKNSDKILQENLKE